MSKVLVILAALWATSAFSLFANAFAIFLFPSCSSCSAYECSTRFEIPKVNGPVRFPQNFFTSADSLQVLAFLSNSSDIRCAGQPPPSEGGLCPCRWLRSSSRCLSPPERFCSLRPVQSPGWLQTGIESCC